MRKLLLIALGALMLASLRPEAAQASTAVLVADLNVRVGPSTAYHSIAVIPAGAAVHVLDCANGWCRIQVDGIVGYVSERYLRFAGYAAVPHYVPPPVYGHRYHYYSEPRRSFKKYRKVRPHISKPRYYKQKKHSAKKYRQLKKHFGHKRGYKDSRSGGKIFRGQESFRDKTFGGKKHRGGKSYRRGGSFGGGSYKRRSPSSGAGSWNESSYTPQAPRVYAVYVGERRIMSV